MKIIIHEVDLNGRPIHAAGTILEGEDSSSILGQMRRQTPFTEAMWPLEYMTHVLANVGDDKPLPGDPSTVVDEFLRRLAAHGLVSYLPDTVIDMTEKEAPKCADKQG